MSSLNGLGVLVGGSGPFAVDINTGRDLDLALIAGVVKFVSECGSHLDN